ncbi:nodulation protein NfeD [Geminicoccaceae bacterium 1502E]|nr:nodulation protein NfeD [Geminicoccaceae bacterium 1502E]
MRGRWLVLAALLLALSPAAGARGQERAGLLLDLEGVIGPAGADYVARGIAQAEEERRPLVVLRIDTPGGLDQSMRTIIRAVLASPVPVVSWVAPSGARAASAGTYIIYASHVAAMAPGTNLGAATPVQIGGFPGQERPGPEEDRQDDEKPAKPGTAMERKLVNDAVAYIRSLAELRGRNAEWGEMAVREGASLSAAAALREGVIELIAADREALLEGLDGRSVTTTGGEVRLATQGLELEARPADWRTRLLAAITQPTVAYILMLIGIYGIILEFYTPGLMGPGLIGAVCLLLALYAFQMLPVSYAGLALIALGVLLMVAEAFVGGFGVLGIVGIVAFVAGSVMLIDTEVPGFVLPLPLIGAIAFTASLLLLALGFVALRSRRRPVAAGPPAMLRERGRVLSWADGQGSVRVHGEVWQARGAGTLAPGDTVRVCGRDGLVLEVEAASADPAGLMGRKADA